jgi:drug/metabolite transporter (DMT)-like permease
MQGTYLIYGVLILIQVLFGFNFAASKIIVKELDPILWSNIRFLLSGIILGVVTLILKRKHPPMTREFFLPIIPLSLMGMALGQGLFLFGLKKTTSINTAIISTAIPLLTLMIVILRGQEKLTWMKFLGFICALLGVIFLRDFENFQLSSETFMGDMMVLLGGLCFAIYLSYGKQFLQKFDNLWITTWMFLISGIFMFLFNFNTWSNFSIPVLEMNFMVSAGYSIIGATVLTYFLNNWALKQVPSGVVALFIYLQPMVAAIVGWAILGEELTLRMLFASLLILLGVVLSIVRKNP